MSRLSSFRWPRLVVALLLTLGCVASATAAELVLREALSLQSLGRSSRNTIVPDALEARVVRGEWQPPRAGDQLTLPDGGVRTWTNVTADAEGWFPSRGMRGGYTFFRVPSAQPVVRVLNATGHSMAYVNGEPRAGDLYGYGYVEVPVALHAGDNAILVAPGRGRLRVRLLEPKAPCYFNLADSTVPDLLAGERVRSWAAVVVVNATTNWASDLVLDATLNHRRTRTPVPAIPPLGVRKVGFRLESASPRDGEKTGLGLTLRAEGNRREPLDQASLELRVRRPDQTHKRTFVSDIDGSVQYFAVNPGAPLPPGVRPALFLSLHGASVEAMGQAEAYAPKRWGTIVCPTNRRPYAFDWEDWGRLDTLEVLDRAIATFRPDPAQVYLTGHSMGGHGTWNFGATFPDRFAAIAPSAGWISFFSYGGSDPFTNATPVEAMLRRAAASSDTLALATNYLHHGVYVLHGDADDNVPVREARRMREVLGAFHYDVDGHEQPGAGHWWENSDEPGAECVDWPPMFDFFARHRVPAGRDLRKIQFVTVNPGVSSRSHWVAIEAQEHALQPSGIDAQWDPGRQRLIVTTTNARRVAFETAEFGPATNGFRVEIDGQHFEGLSPGETTAAAPTWRRPLRLERHEERWTPAEAPLESMKRPERNGPFKDAFRHRMIFVFGTQGTSEENAWALAKARFDAEAFWYRGNGSVDVMPDVAFDPARTRDRGVILYGHRDMNRAWPLLLANSPVQVGRGRVVVGGREEQRADLACLFLQPRPDSAVACVGVVAGSGTAGLRLTNRLPYFMAGPGFPDCLVLSPEALEQGTRGVVAAGFFGADWSVERGEFAWQ